MQKYELGLDNLQCIFPKVQLTFESPSHKQFVPLSEGNLLLERADYRLAHMLKNVERVDLVTCVELHGVCLPSAGK